MAIQTQATLQATAQAIKMQIKLEATATQELPNEYYTLKNPLVACAYLALQSVPKNYYGFLNWFKIPVYIGYEVVEGQVIDTLYLYVNDVWVEMTQIEASYTLA